MTECMLSISATYNTMHAQYAQWLSYANVCHETESSLDRWILVDGRTRNAL